MNDLEKKLVEALRSGKYQRTTGKLRDDNGFCCLGVACDLYDPSLWLSYEDLIAIYGGDDNEESEDFLEFRHEYGTKSIHSGEVLPEFMKSELGWSDDSGTLRFRDRQNFGIDLAMMNDGRGEMSFTFDQIADTIAANLVLCKGETLANVESNYAGITSF